MNSQFQSGCIVLCIETQVFMQSLSHKEECLGIQQYYMSKHEVQVNEVKLTFFVTLSALYM